LQPFTPPSQNRDTHREERRRVRWTDGERGKIKREKESERSKRNGEGGGREERKKYK
jgi:hypothetical protein